VWDVSIRSRANSNLRIIHDHTVDHDPNTNRFEKWQLCGVWKLLLCEHRTLTLTQNWVCFTNPCINLFVPSSVTLLDLLYLLQCNAAHLQHTLLRAFGETYYVGPIRGCFQTGAVARRWNESNVCWRHWWVDASSAQIFVKRIQWILKSINSDTSWTRLLLFIQFT